MCNKEEPNFSCYLIFFPPAKNINYRIVGCIIATSIYTFSFY